MPVKVGVIEYARKWTCEIGPCPNFEWMKYGSINNTISHLRWPLQQLLPSVSPAPADAAGETPLSGSAAAQHPGSQFGAAGALLCGLPPLWKSCVGAALQRVCLNISSASAWVFSKNLLCLQITHFERVLPWEEIIGERCHFWTYWSVISFSPS